MLAPHCRIYLHKAPQSECSHQAGQGLNDKRKLDSIGFNTNIETLLYVPGTYQSYLKRVWNNDQMSLEPEG